MTHERLSGTHKPAVYDLLVSMEAHQKRVRRDSEELGESRRALGREFGVAGGAVIQSRTRACPHWVEKTDLRR
jgi:hypothetical protein